MIFTFWSLLGSIWFNFRLSVLLVVGFLREMSGNSGRLGHGFEAALAFLNVLLWVEDDDINFGDVQHAEGHRGTQAHGHGQRGGLNEHLVQGGKKIKSNISAWPQL